MQWIVIRKKNESKAIDCISISNEYKIIDFDVYKIIKYKRADNISSRIS